MITFLKSVYRDLSNLNLVDITLCHVDDDFLIFSGDNPHLISKYSNMQMIGISLLTLAYSVRNNLCLEVINNPNVFFTFHNEGVGGYTLD